MIISLLLNVVTLIVGSIFTLFPAVTKLPVMFGFDIDAAFVSGMGIVYRVYSVFWPLQIVLNGALFLLGYYLLKLGIRFLFGHRAPN